MTIYCCGCWCGNACFDFYFADFFTLCHTKLGRIGECGNTLQFKRLGIKVKITKRHWSEIGCSILSFGTSDICRVNPAMRSYKMWSVEGMKEHEKQGGWKFLFFVISVKSKFKLYNLIGVKDFKSYGGLLSYSCHCLVLWWMHYSAKLKISFPYYFNQLFWQRFNCSWVWEGSMINVKRHPLV